MKSAIEGKIEDIADSQILWDVDFVVPFSISRELEDIFCCINGYQKYSKFSCQTERNCGRAWRWVVEYARSDQQKRRNTAGQWNIWNFYRFTIYVQFVSFLSFWPMFLWVRLLRGMVGFRWQWWTARRWSGGWPTRFLSLLYESLMLGTLGGELL